MENQENLIHYDAHTRAAIPNYPKPLTGAATRETVCPTCGIEMTFGCDPCRERRMRDKNLAGIAQHCIESPEAMEAIIEIFRAVNDATI